MIHLKLLLLSSLVISLACTSFDSKNTNTPAKNVLKQANNNSCLEKYLKETCGMISSERLSEIVGVDSKIVNQELKEFSVLKTFSCSYQWDTGRTVSVETAVGKFDSKVKNNVTIGPIKILMDLGPNTTFKNQFDDTFDDRTEEEKAALLSDLAERTKDESELVQNLTKDFGKVINDISHIPIHSIGDGAYCSKTKDGHVLLYVLHKNLFFNMNVNISNDIEENLAAAIKISKEILLLCE